MKTDRIATPPKAEPTREQLALAYRHYATPAWPATLDEAVAHWAYGPCIRQLALRMRRPGWRDVHAVPHSLPRNVGLPPTPTAPREVPKAAPRGGSAMHTTSIAYWHSARTQPPQLMGPDHKKLAANDRDD